MSQIYAVRKKFKGISWQHPVLNTVFHLLDPFDAVVRQVNGLAALPPYSVRVRSTGVTRQFGGQMFKRYGDVHCRLLQDYAALTHNDHVLEIGCGCGRVALALARVLAHGHYLGVDIDKPSLDACRKSKLLSQKQFRFELLEIRNSVWNPHATQHASSYVFPYADASFDIVFLFSVFTHMLPADLSNYVKEIGRMLRPQGRVLISVFLMDYGNITHGLSLPIQQTDCFLHNEAIPEKAVGYASTYLIQEFAKYQLALSTEPLLGQWRRQPQIAPSNDFGQDMLIFQKHVAP